MSRILESLIWLYHELGLSSLVASGRNAWLIVAARCLRMFAFGINAFLLAIFLSSLGISDARIGLFMTLTLVGDVLLSLLLTFVADGLGRRLVLFLGGVLMTASGIVFALSENYFVLLIAAVLGVISPSGNEIGPFRALEESTLSHLTVQAKRADVFTWYIVMATVGTTAGLELCGALVDGLAGRKGWSEKDAYHAAFWIYTAVGMLQMMIATLLTAEVELHASKKSEEDESSSNGESPSTQETEPLLSNNSPPRGPVSPTNSQTSQPSGSESRRIFTHFTPQSRRTLFTLLPLFTLDALGTGLLPFSLLNYYLDLKYSLPKTVLGTIMASTWLLGIFTTMLSAPLTRRLGPIYAMVSTHLPAALFQSSLPLAPARPRAVGVPVTVALLLGRACLNSMDQAPRAAFLAAVVRPEERTAVMGAVNVMRTAGGSVGPGVAGWLVERGQWGWVFAGLAILKGAYDVGLLAAYGRWKPEKDGEETLDGRGERESNMGFIEEEEEEEAGV